MISAIIILSIATLSLSVWIVRISKQKDRFKTKIAETKGEALLAKKDLARMESKFKNSVQLSSTQAQEIHTLKTDLKNLEDMKITTLLSELRNSNPIIQDIFLNGSCCNLYFILKAVYPSAEAYYNHEHVITKIDGKFYDITGEVSSKGYSPIGDVFTMYKTDQGIKSGSMCDPENKTQYVRKS